MLLFQLAYVVEQMDVIGPNGKPTGTGCELVAKAGTIRRPLPADHKFLPHSPHVGALKYFDAASGNAVWYGGKPEKIDKSTSSSGQSGFPNPRMEPFHDDNTGKTLAKPEQELLDEFVFWLGGRKRRFERGRLASAEVHIDLLIRDANLLVEAKATCAREIVRLAVGQLYDYRCFIPRKPRLAVLLPTKPSLTIQRFLASRRIHCVWRTPKGRFSDGSKGAATRDLRKPRVAVE